MRHQDGLLPPAVVLHWLRLWHTGATIFNGGSVRVFAGILPIPLAVMRQV